MRRRSIAALASLCIPFSIAGAADAPGQRPVDRSARAMLEKAVSIPTQLGNDRVPELAEYLAAQ
ncbi:MAG TPA: hypothetical protein VFP37_12810, partial [Steroidobacteraceae bacterium]|nr:hypothetical protein [Steroidobacteraceae bacterium]